MLAEYDFSTGERGKYAFVELIASCKQVLLDFDLKGFEICFEQNFYPYQVWVTPKKKNPDMPKLRTELAKLAKAIPPVKGIDRFVLLCSIDPLDKNCYNFLLGNMRDKSVIKESKGSI
jgi:hypothetical protein